MKTTATNRKVRVLLTALRDGKLVPRPEFQRRLVWTNKDKCAFLQTVLLGYPFPEIYLAAGDVNLETGEGSEMLVDGQQRITTLHQYFSGSEGLRLGKEITPYTALQENQKRDFLEYDVVVRDLGKMSIEEIKEVFRRINSTNYSLNAMEIHNARFDGEFKRFGESTAQHPFFDNHRVFSAAEIRRMQDTQFALMVIITFMSTYFNRDSEVETYLERYNDEFELKEDLTREIETVLEFVDSCQFGPESRVWKKADLFTLLVEVHRAIVKEKVNLSPGDVGSALSKFYERVDMYDPAGGPDKALERYSKAALQASNDRSNRIARGEIVRNLIGARLPVRASV
jgi:uncharacterized protein DUF262